MKRIFITCLLLFISLYIGVTPVRAEEKKVGTLRYEYKAIDKKTCWITKIEILNKEKAKVIRIPSTLGGKRVVKLGEEGDANYIEYGTNIFHVEENDAGGYSPYDVYEKTKAVKEIILPDTLEEVTRNCFKWLPQLKKITIPAKLKTGGRYLCDTKWTSFQVAKNNPYYKVSKGFLLSKSGKTVYGLTKKMKKVKIPDGVEKIGEAAFLHCKADSIYLPKSINGIGYQAFRNDKKVVELSISKKNKRYAMKGDCLYSKKSGRLVAAINRNNKLVIPNGVTKLNTNVSVVGIGKKEMRKETSYGVFTDIIIPKSVTRLEDNWDTYLFWRYAVEGRRGQLCFKGTKPPKIGKYAMPADITVYVPAKAYNAYKKELDKHNHRVDLRKMK